MRTNTAKKQPARIFAGMGAAASGSLPDKAGNKIIAIPTHPIKDPVAGSGGVQSDMSEGAHLLGSLPPFLTAEQAGELLQIHPVNIRGMCRDGALPAVKLGSRWRIVTAGLEQMITSVQER